MKRKTCLFSLGDPLGTFKLRPENYKAIGVHIGKMGLPTVVIQEGGYSANEMLGSCAAALISGIMEGAN